MDSTRGLVCKCEIYWSTSNSTKEFAKISDFTLCGNGYSGLHFDLLPLSGAIMGGLSMSAKHEEIDMAIRCRVLLAEDNHVNQEVGRAMLESFGCRVDVAENGCEVLHLLESTIYDLIFMDCQMPSMDGCEATRKIRQNQNPKVAGIPVVALTAHVMDGDRERCLAVGMDDYLGKPFRLQQLSEILERWTNRGRNADGKSGGPDENELSGPVALAEEAVAPVDQIRNPVCVERGVLENIRSIFGASGHEMLMNLIRIFIDDSPALLDKMSNALQTRDAVAMAKAAHALKSSSANLGAVSLAGFCRMVEDIARTDSTGSTESIIAQIQAEYVRVKKALEGELQRGI
jgi:two-component system, sensor histidine kinase and response regulator